MSVESDYSGLAERLLTIYAKKSVELARKKAPKRTAVRDSKDAAFARTIQRNYESLSKYSLDTNIDQALDAIDLAKIYEGVDAREANAAQEERSSAHGYEDFIVMETLKYFKNDFFKWVNKPDCSQCHTDKDMNFIGRENPPSPNPDEIAGYEVYKCSMCNQRATFARINNPATLLRTREGRCGEWVNCFMLVLRAVLGSEVPIRHVWNAEDHVWCEYYSRKMRRWVHLDPCENAYDEPSLYCENWGKKMSWVVGIGFSYVADLSDKYITKEDKRIPKATVANEVSVRAVMDAMNARILLNVCDQYASLPLAEDERWYKLYEDILLPMAQERKHTLSATKTSTLPKGRQTGSAEWTAGRGEDGG